MQKKISARLCVIFFIIIALLFTGFFTGCEFTICPDSPGQDPDDPGGSLTVIKEEKIISAPLAGYLEVFSPESIPEECSEIRYLRFGFEGLSPEDADIILVIMPGVLVSNNVFDYMGKQMVAMAKEERNVTLEIWCPDRRYNNIEDLTGVDAAEAAQDTGIAIDYYYHNKEVNGKTFDGFLENEDVPFLSEFGLKIVMEDIHTLITTLVPDQETRRKKVFVGGHSLGGFLTAFFAGWDFDGDPSTIDDAGYMNCAGIIGLDTLVCPFIELFDPLMALLPQCMQFLVPATINTSYPAIVDNLHKGNLPVILPSDIVGFCPETYMMLELVGMRANLAPDEESTLLDEVPYSFSVETLLRLIHSHNIIDFIKSQPSIHDFRYTNEALLGVMLDDNFMPIPISQGSIGFLSGGDVSKKYFPFPGSISDIDPVVDLVGILLTGDDLYIASDLEARLEPGSGPLYTWTNFDEVDDSFAPFTSPIEEVTDLHVIANTMYKGPTNLMEWYFPTRLILDMMAAKYEIGPKYGLNYLHPDYDKNLKCFNRLAGHGPFVEVARNEGIDVDLITIEGYDHFDMLTAATEQPERRENEVFLPMIDFMISAAQ
ncbi:MAG: hypothetical protein GY754_43445 [bacterium]|nr:hypothetical protein [bacterium]